MSDFRLEIMRARDLSDKYCAQYKDCASCPLSAIRSDTIDCYIACAIALTDGTFEENKKTTYKINK